MSTANTSKEQLKKKLDALQCHFTWKLGATNPQHLLQKLDVEIKHMAHQNRAALLGLRAYLHQLNNQSTEALQSLRAAEEHNNQEEQPASTAGSLIAYGNYAWIHYLQGSYQEAETCLERVQQLCPALWDVQLILHIQAQKGWSLLAVRARNGERARECFNLALMLEPENVSCRTGLGMALYSSWKFSWQPDIASEATTHLERIVDEQPNNYRAKIYLADLLARVNREKSRGLIDECAERSSDPEVIKLSALFWLPRSTERAIEIIQRALEQDPGYHLLYQALAKCYKQQWIRDQKGDNNILDAAISHLEQIVQEHPDLDLTLVKLQLAELIGARHPAREEKIYRDLQVKINTLSTRCRQALNCFWGKFFYYKRGDLDKAKAKFMDGYNIPEQSYHRRECERMLRKTAQAYNKNGDANAAKAISRFLQETNQHVPAHFAALSLDDEDDLHSAEQSMAFPKAGKPKGLSGSAHPLART